MSRRGAGEGSISQRRDGRWQASIMAHGVRKTVYGKTEREARRKLLALQKELHTLGALPDAGNKTVDDLLDAWLETATPNLKARTIETYHELCERHIRPAIGKVRLARLTPEMVQAILTTLQAQGKDRTAQQVCTYLHRAMSLAVLWRWLPENILNRVLKPGYRAPRKDVWTPDELSSFLEGARQHWLYPLWTLAIATGLRSGELCALTWQDMDADRLSVGATMHRLNGEYVRHAPKTDAATRTVSLPDVAIAALRRQRAQQAAWRLRAGDTWQGAGLVFTGKTGRPLNRAVITHALQRECARLALPVVTMHGLRHLHASLLLEGGVSIAQVSKRMGHATPAITLAVYSHVVNRKDDAVTDAISKAMQG